MHGPKWDAWMAVNGTAVGHLPDRQRDGLFEVYNVSLVEVGNRGLAVLKKFKSGIDFLKQPQVTALIKLLYGPHHVLIRHN